MLNFEQASLSELIIHRVGNQSLQDTLHISEGPVAMNDDALYLVGQTLTTPFLKDDLYYNFYHETDVALNKQFTFLKRLFEKNIDLYEFSKQAAQTLYSVILNPKIRGGELWIGKFSNILINDEAIEAVGLFFFDRKKQFIRLRSNDSGYAIETEQGFDPSDHLVGSLICNIQEEQGYLIRINGKTKGTDYKLWTDDFLILKQNIDDYYKTQTAMNLCHDFVMEKMPENFDITRPDQAELLNKSFGYFSENDKFDLDNYSNEILQQPELKESFNHFSKQYSKEHDVDLTEEIDVNEKAVKKLSRVFKSVIKLDKNFHVYVHGDHDYIKRGRDEELGMNFYQLYFKEEN